MDQPIAGVSTWVQTSVGVVPPVASWASAGADIARVLVRNRPEPIVVRILLETNITYLLNELG
jgi:hypothetical protein